MRKPIFVYAKTKAQISLTVTVKLVSILVFAKRIVQFLLFLNPKDMVTQRQFCKSYVFLFPCLLRPMYMYRSPANVKMSNFGDPEINIYIQISQFIDLSIIEPRHKKTNNVVSNQV